MSTDSAGTKQIDQGNLPFGEPWYTSSTTTKWRFTTYERDTESGNDYAMQRYYINRFGRFTSVDPIGGDVTNAQTWNRYAYVGNDPVNVIDPLGMKWIIMCFGYAEGGGGACTWIWSADAQDECGIDGCENDQGELGNHPRKEPKDPKNCTPGTKGCLNIPSPRQQCEANAQKEFDSSIGSIDIKLDMAAGAVTGGQPCQ